MDILTINDTPGEHPKGSYYAASAGPPPNHPSLKGEIKVDVCIIGGGYTGLSTALHLAKAGYKVAILEANRIGWGASGRNGGQLHPGQRRDQQELEEIVGNTHAKDLWDLSEEALDLVKKLIRDHAIDCDFTEGLVQADVRVKDADYSRHYADFLQEEYNFSHVEFLDRQALKREVASHAYHGGLYFPKGGHLHPLKYALGLAKAANDQGAIIYENSRVVAIEDGQDLKIKTAHGIVHSDFLVLALNGYHNDLQSSLTHHVMPLNNFMIATEPLDEARARQIIARNAAVSDSHFIVNYFRFSPDHRLIFGGGETFSYQFPKNMAEIARKRMITLFPDLRDIKTDYAWGGTLGISVNRMPFFNQEKARIFSAGGFSGHGLAIATQAGQLISEAIRQTSERFALMENVPSHRFPGGRLLRWPLLAFSMAAASLRDKMG